VAPTGDPLVYAITVACSSGTYVRSLAADLGRHLGGGAHLRALRRTAIGSFTESDATSVEDVVLAPAAVALRDYPRVEVGAAVASAIAHGKAMTRHDLVVDGDGPWAVVDREGVLLAVYEVGFTAGVVRPAVVLASAG